jgi:hypothetical protein
MFFLTAAECSERLSLQGLNETDVREQARASYRPPGALRVDFENRRRSIVLARNFVEWIGPVYACLFWITEHGAWPSSENEHLYYRLRRSYADARRLIVAPGHDFLSDERTDLITFLSLAIDFGWGGALLPSKHPAARLAFLSHDGWLRIEQPLHADRILAEADALGLGTAQ